MRAIAKRALQTINTREEQEKLNVWIALLNFENLHGTEVIGGTHHSRLTYETFE